MIHGSTLSMFKQVRPKIGYKVGEDVKADDHQSTTLNYRGPSCHDLLKDQVKNTDLWTALGQVLEMKREYAQAAAAHRHGLELDPGNPDIAFAWARAALSAGDYGQAKEAIRQLRYLDPLRVGPRLLDHPVMLKGRAEDAAMAKEKPIVKVQVGPRTSGIFPQRENVNTVPPQDPNKNAAPRQM